jgi:hypothetical protein
MNPRHPWWLAGALVCVSAVGAHRALASDVPVLPAAVAMTVERTLLGPLRLVRPLDPATIERAVHEADSLYLGLKYREAYAAFVAVVELDPLNAFAWLRLGNLDQQAGRDDEALKAYGRASAPPPVSAAAAEARGKALLNIALLSVARAGRAMDELDAMHALALEAAREDAAQQLAEQRLRADRAMSPQSDVLTRTGTAPRSDTVPRFRDEGEAGMADSALPPAARSPARMTVPVGVPVTRAALPAIPAAVPAAAGRLPPETRSSPDAFEPYTVDRWIATPRRPAARTVQARPAVTEPLRSVPLPPPPVVESFSGAAQRGPLR